MYLIEELILKKRDGLSLDGAEIKFFVEGVTADSVSDAQIAAFAMSVWFQGLDLSEQMALTLAMRDSGEVLRWNQLDGPVLDKHSTGGVGDLVSLILGPLVAACGAYVPMISGRECPSPGRSPFLRRTRCDGHSGLDSADCGIHSFQETGGGPRWTCDGRQVGLRSLYAEGR